MAPACCSFIPPYLLQDIVAGQNAEAGHLAKQALVATEHIHRIRKGCSEARHGHSGQHGPGPVHQIVPDYILEDLMSAEGVDETTKQQANQTLTANRHLRQQRVADAKTVDAIPAAPAAPAKPTRSVYNMQGLTKFSDKKVDISYTLLPGKLVRAEGQAAVSDKAVNDVYDHTLQILQFFQTVFQYQSLDGHNMPVVCSVHTSWNLLNASWIGIDTDVTPNVTYNQMAYGDGLPAVFAGFTNSLDVIGHEMTVGKLVITVVSRAHITDTFSMLLHNSKVR